MRVLVTGGAGFIGSHLCEALLAAGQEVVALDDASAGSWDNLTGASRRTGLTMVEGSVLDAAAVGRAMEGCETVYHLAAVLGVARVFADPVRTIETNVRGTSIVLEAARIRGCKVLVASTSEVYGRGSGRKFVETDDIQLGRSLRWGYACSKAVDEYLARAHYRESELPTVVARYFNVVGPRQNLAYGAVVPRFVTQALRNEPITVYGDGTQVRSFTWIGDAVRASIDLLDHPAAFGEVFNVGGEDSVQIRVLAERVKQVVRTDAPIVHTPYDEIYGIGFEDVQFRVPDVTKLKQLLGYGPTMNLDGILARVIDSLRATAGRRGA